MATRKKGGELPADTGATPATRAAAETKAADFMLADGEVTIRDSDRYDTNNLTAAQLASIVPGADEAAIGAEEIELVTDTAVPQAPAQPPAQPPAGP